MPNHYEKFWQKILTHNTWRGIIWRWREIKKKVNHALPRQHRYEFCQHFPTLIAFSKHLYFWPGWNNLVCHSITQSLGKKFTTILQSKWMKGRSAYTLIFDIYKNYCCCMISIPFIYFLFSFWLGYMWTASRMFTSISTISSQYLSS